MSSSFVPNPAVILFFFIITSGSGRENQTFFTHKCELSISQWLPFLPELQGRLHRFTAVGVSVKEHTGYH